MKIFFIQAGGTIDKNYTPEGDTHGYNFRIEEPSVSEILNIINPDFEYEIASVVKKDSLDMTDEDRQAILKKCKKVIWDKIIITHGTDRFVKTAEVLSEIKNKTIILTGAHKPEKFKNSDADFNIGVAIGAISNLKQGVYISLNGIVYPWDKYKYKG